MINTAIPRALAMVVLLTGIASGQQAQKSTSSNEQESSKNAPTNFGQKGADQIPAAATNDPDYVIGPEDALHISVWKEPELSGSVPVRPDGKISLPLLNDVQAAGNTPMKLSAAITQQLQQYVTDPHVTVVVTGINSKRVFLVGEVGHNGAMTMLPNMTVLQALSSAGGFSQFANMKKIYILRNLNGQQVRIPVNYKAIISGRSPEQNILLKPGDTIVVP